MNRSLLAHILPLRRKDCENLDNLSVGCYTQSRDLGLFYAYFMN
jgi:hypothetical protein